MATTLSHGYIKPTNPDTGDIYFPALETDIQKLNDHTHNGTDGAQLSLGSISIPAVSWIADGTVVGLYKQVVTLPAGYLYDSTEFFFRLSTGEAVYPSVVRASSSTFTVYTNDNSLAYVGYYR